MSTPTRPATGQHAAPGQPAPNQPAANPPAATGKPTQGEVVGQVIKDRAAAAAAKPGSETPDTNGNKRRGRMPGQPAKEYDFKGLDVTFLSDPKPVDDTIAAITAPQRARDERQVAMDGVIAQKYREWKAEGSPTKWAQMPKARYHLVPTQVEGFRFLVRRSAEFHGVTIKWGTPKADKDGRQVIVFAVRAKRERVTATDKNDDDTAGEE